ncbi:MAG: SDR family oxidoreductase [Eubacterium sp.]|jgi:Short-chain dehydrogenases of various substrate specificities|nr:SDR family oxidoreductase [Eubacterium sp.]
MKEKNILITGASQGIGAKTAEYLSAQGATVVLVARNADKLKSIQTSISGRSYIVPYDLNDLGHVQTIFDFCIESGIKLNGMVYCAGVNHDIPVRNNDVGLMCETLTVNYMAFVELSKYFIKKKYSEDDGSIVAVSSLATNRISSGMSTYTSSKAALEAAVKVLAKEVIKRRIRVNAIAPACVDTEMIDHAPFIKKEELCHVQPLGLIETAYVSYLAEFLLSAKAKYITGAVIPVSAGNL